MNNSNLELSLAYALIMLFGIIQCGKFFVACISKLTNGIWLDEFIGQYAVFGAVFVSLFVSWGSVLISGSRFYYVAANLLILIGLLGVAFVLYGMLSRIVSLPTGKILTVGIRKCRYSKFNSIDIIILLTLVLYGFANFGLITNGDSLDYHIGYALNYLREPFESYPEWYSGRLAQVGEKVIALGLTHKSQSFASLFQYAGLVALTSLLYSTNTFGAASSNNNKMLTLAFVCSPVLLFLAITAKPQLMPTAMSTIAFILVLRTFFDKNWSNNVKKISLLVAIILVSVAATHKSSFLISLAMLGCLATFSAYRIKHLRSFLLITVVIFVIVFFPAYWDKYQRYHSSLLEFFVSPVGGFSDSLKMFIDWIKNYRENPLSFPLYLLIPSSFGNFTTVFGIGMLVAGYGFFRLPRTMRPIKLMLAFFILVLWGVGQPSSRFYLEPYIWVMLLLASEGKAVQDTQAPLFFKLVLIAQSIAVILVLFIFDWSVLGSFVPDGQHKFLNKYVNGYDMSQWVAKELAPNVPILLDHRSVALYSRITLSTEPILFMSADASNLQMLRQDLLKYDVSYVVTQADSPIYGIISKCSEGVFAGPETFHLATRNPFNSGASYTAYILLIRPTRFVDCIQNFSLLKG